MKEYAVGFPKLSRSQMQHTQFGHSETYSGTLSTFSETQKETSLKTMMEML